jgi:hypothetical protein
MGSLGMINTQATFKANGLTGDIIGLLSNADSVNIPIVTRNTVGWYCQTPDQILRKFLLLVSSSRSLANLLSNPISNV